MTTEEIWKQFSSKLRGFLMQRVSDEQAAEDILQEVFTRIHKNLGKVQDQQKVGSWIFQIARNQVIDYYRSKGRAPEFIDADNLAASHEEQNFNEVVADWLPIFISNLPEKYREAVELYELKGLQQQEIADRLGISLSGAKSRVQRGREKLKSQLFDCCSFERDRHGNIIDYTQRKPGPNDCDISPDDLSESPCPDCGCD